MLSAFEAQLKNLAEEKWYQFHCEIRNRVGKRATPVFENKLKNLIVETPKRLNSIYRHWNQIKNGDETRHLGGFILAYLYNPTDFLSSEDYGLFGYLDDAYLVALAYERVLWEAHVCGNPLTEEEEDYLVNMKETRKLVRTIIPAESKQIEQMLQELIGGKKGRYLSSFRLSSEAGARIAEAGKQQV
ncbi:MAG: DUF1232 domain-containing protein [Candidatus Omnitrophica bacterium]|nr:DUF1232 domain-containing protein [Candidatus Omnitrophota bacterium]